MTAQDLVQQWSATFLERLQDGTAAAPLKEASLGGRLADWTGLLTASVVGTCEDLGWAAAAKGFPLEILPQTGQEYLGMDVMAFPQARPGDDAGPGWQFPVAVFELENSREDDRVAYSLWKVVCVRAELRAVFAYRETWEEGRKLVTRLTENVIGPMLIAERTSLGGETLVIVGCRGEGETFPWGYFKFWKLDCNLGRFEKV